jgi:hypothetical protein
VEAHALLRVTEVDYREEPRAALIQGLVLAALGRREDSERFFALVPAEILLPEEAALIATARERR